MKTSACLISVGLALAAPLARAETGAAATAAQVRAADMAFEQRAQSAGVAQAFRDFMDEKDGLQFGAGAPTRGAEAIYQANVAPFAHMKLEWAVVDAWGSKSGDLGVTTGTWRAQAQTGAGPALTGRYVTVWRKNAAGAWKGLIDIGNPDPK